MAAMTTSVSAKGVSEQELLEQGRHRVLQGDLAGARIIFSEAEKLHPSSGEIRVSLAGLLWQMGQQAQAETLLRDWLSRYPDHITSTFLLAELLRDQGRLQAVAQVMRRLFDQGRQDPDTVIQAVEMLDDYGRPQDASAICEAEIAAGSTDARIYAYAGMLGIQLGEFVRTRQHYLFALEHSAEAVEWNIPIGLAGLQRYQDINHPDFALFREVLDNPSASAKARNNTLFALAKAHDDLADYARAAHYLREANAHVRAARPWPRKHWKRAVEGRLVARPYSFAPFPVTEWTPVFIVGVPRSGTTLVAELMGRHRCVRNRGELGWLQTLAHQLSRVPRDRREPFEHAAARYEAQLRQGDTEPLWFIDKQPLNLMHVDLIMTLWPSARIIHCQRSARDTALSLWSQSFHDRAHDYAYDFNDIATVIQGCRRLMAHWSNRYPQSIRTVRYETLVTTPEDTVTELFKWLELPVDENARPWPNVEKGRNTSISTASAWQARQPVHGLSAGRWRKYADYIPELLRIPEH